ncbi:MAG: T9SS type A sorting domain-containing protein [Bacteroidetes bacterium]|nr:T9SS type A sorting domain-containing protein [Bacteroidota bacterium]
MKKQLLFVVIFFNVFSVVFSQNISPSRITDWSSPGCMGDFNYLKSVKLTDFGADISGNTPSDTAFQLAISALNGAGEIYVPKGIYLFNKPIYIHDSIIIRGEMDSLDKSPAAGFLLSPNENHGIIIAGSQSLPIETLTYALMQGQQKITVTNALSYSVGDFIKLKANDDGDLITSSWALNSTGQIFQITQITANDLILNKPIRRNYSGMNLPDIVKIIPVKQVHIKCIKLQRMNETVAQSANIYFDYAADCSVSGIESNYCNYAHVLIENSIRISVENSYFQNGITYGDGGKAYGTLLQFTTGDCFVHQNIFKHLRHSMVLQAGANGNVFAYNYSTDPYWTDVALPSNSAGDITLHGNYIYMNLFEGNVIQNIVIDNSHGYNGPFNTFFRNRAELWGILMNSGSANQTNFICNQITNNSLYPIAFYSLTGNDNFEYANVVKGRITPYQTYEPAMYSMFAYNFASYYSIVGVIPPIRTSNWKTNDPLTESSYRYKISDKKAICSEIIYDASLVLQPDEKFEIFPNPIADEFILKNKSDRVYLTIKIYNMLGKLVYTRDIHDKFNTFNIKELNSGMYFLRIDGLEKIVLKIIKINPGLL